ncbi:NYN domain-containing protein [Peloplasma aerotolerans]|uniref:NYN domain-containing protein n=1 Tax=Peloplasma aerotolerans TaxID=3044389 RepID=A0AAW6U9T5_9MOLU|nr:NYN domain-containing protein [Mariniplasma sp. M4Ah]MDI6452719.1 NYN domain-containing protein [Mariniplasma sp. M4Ah]MDR4968171.1 NYN domain-containing protein [Acholeplasmataceae bacterium]
MEKTEYKIALMIDSENVSFKYIKSVMNEISKYGKIVIARFYGDINNLSRDWHRTAQDNAIKPVHQYNVAVGKNAADMAMALDAQEVMYQGRVNAFFLVTSDSDFTPLAVKLREGGMHVIGVGNEKKVTEAFRSACNEFKYFEYLDDEDEDDEIPESVEASSRNTQEIGNIIKSIIIENGIDNKIQLSRLGDILVNRFSDFDSRKYGAKTLSSLVNTISGLAISQEKTTTFVTFYTKMNMKDVTKAIIDIISMNKSKEMILTKIKQELEKIYPEFNYQELGFTRFSKLVGSIDSITVKNNAAKLKVK